MKSSTTPSPFDIKQPSILFTKHEKVTMNKYALAKKDMKPSVFTTYQKAKRYNPTEE